MHGCLYLFPLQAPAFYTQTFHLWRCLHYILQGLFGGRLQTGWFGSWDLEKAGGGWEVEWRGNAQGKRLEADCCSCCVIAWSGCGLARHGALLSAVSTTRCFPLPFLCAGTRYASYRKSVTLLTQCSVGAPCLLMSWSDIEMALSERLWQNCHLTVNLEHTGCLWSLSIFLGYLVSS